MNSNRTALDDSVTGNLVPLNALPADHRLDLIRQGRLISLEPGETFEGRAAENETTFYLLDGELELLRDDRCLLVLEGGSEPARFALSQLRGPELTARARTPARLLGVDMSMLSTLLIWAQSTIPGGAGKAGSVPWSTDWLPKLLRSELCAVIPPANLNRIFESLEPVAVTAAETVVRQGDPGDYYYVVASGQCEVSRRHPRTRESLRLTKLGPGDSFGEEALITGARRNASVTMLSDGILLRLTKDDFLELVIDPALSTVTRPAAEALVGAGGRWVDVRLAEEHARDGIPGSFNLPLGHLRRRVEELDRATPYVVYCDTGQRSAVAGFLLGRLGFDPHVLTGGIHGPPAPGPGPGPAEATDLGARAAALRSRLAAADSDLEAALRQKVEATAARRLWARETPGAGPADAAERDRTKTAARLHAEQRRLELQSTDAGRILAQAQQPRLEIEAAIRSEEARAARQRAESEAACQAFRDQADARLQNERRRLQAEYARAESRMEELVRTRDAAQAEYARERERLEREFAEGKAGMEAEAAALEETMRASQRAVEAGARRLREEQAAAETEIRRETEARLRAERERLELELAQSARQIETAEQHLARVEAESTGAEERASRFRAELAEEARQRREAAEREHRGQSADEEKVATERLAEEELRLRLLSEKERWLEDEDRARKQQLEAARGQVEEMARRQRDAQASAERTQLENTNLFADIEAQLNAETDALQEAIGEAAYAEKLFTSTHEAQARTGEEKSRAAEALERARRHIERLKRGDGG